MGNGKNLILFFKQLHAWGEVVGSELGEASHSLENAQK